MARFSRDRLHGVGAGGQAPLVQGHQEPHGPGPPVVAHLVGPHALPLHEGGDLLVEVQLLPLDDEVGGAGDALGEHRLGCPGAVGLELREVDHGLLGPAQVEGGLPLLHRPVDGGDVGVGVLVQQLQEEGEVLGVPLVGGGGQQQDVVGAVPELLPQPVAQALVALVAGRHPVGLVHYHQVPVGLLQAGEDVAALGQVQGGDDPVLVQPLVQAELVVHVAAPHHEELLVELLQELPLPLEGQVGGADDEDPVGQAPELQLPDQEAGHDGLAGAGVVGQQEPDGGQLHEVLVDRFQLVGQRVHPGDGEAEVGVELVGDAQGVGLEGQLEEASVPS